MAIAAAVRAIRKRLKREQAPVEDTELTQRQSWRRLAGGARPDWKSLQAMPFNDGQEFFRLRLEAWLQARRCNPITKRITWQWVSVEASGFKICAGSVRRDPIAEEICMEDVLGVMCTHQISAENKDSEIDSPHERAAYFRRTNLHDSEDASDIQSLVAQVEAEYLVQHGQVPQATGSNPAGLDVELTDRDFAILTTRMGFYRGVPLIFRASCPEEKEQWVETLRRIIKFESASHLAPLSTFSTIRHRVRAVYIGPNTQVTVAILICTNFLANIIEAQSNSLGPALEAVDLVFTALFTLELFVNLFAMLFTEFFSDPWNYFDTIVVVVGLVTLVMPDLPGGSTLKLMRTFRVFRLFKRIPSLKHLVTSIFAAIPAMANAYVLMTILTSIYAILCVRFFGTCEGPGCEPVAADLFGDFFGAMFTLWQVMTGDDWSQIVRDMFEPTGMPAGVALFFVSYQLLITFTMLNVFVCVLVDEFCGGGDELSDNSVDDQPPHADAEKRFRERNTCRLKPLLTDSLACHDLEAFDEMMHQIWHSLCRFAEVADPDKHETAITFEELVIGLRELPYCPPVMFKWQDWTELVVRNELCNSHGLLSRAGFYEMVQLAITRYGKNQLQVAIRHASDDGWTNEAISQYLFALKAKAICIMQHAMWQEEEMLDRRDQDQDAREKPMENARFLNMRKLVWEFNRMHRRFTEVECAPLLHVASRGTKACCCQQSGRPPWLTGSSTHTHTHRWRMSLSV